MEINASSTCKYLKNRKAKSQPDLRNRCLDLRLIGMSGEDAKVLTALYHLYTYGGSIVIESDDLKVSATMGGFLTGETEPASTTDTEATSHPQAPSISSPAKEGGM